jgi:hypothetical protein
MIEALGHFQYYDATAFELVASKLPSWDVSAGQATSILNAFAAANTWPEGEGFDALLRNAYTADKVRRLGDSGLVKALGAIGTAELHRTVGGVAAVRALAHEMVNVRGGLPDDAPHLVDATARTVERMIDDASPALLSALKPLTE